MSWKNKNVSAGLWLTLHSRQVMLVEKTITMFSFFHSSYQNSPENKISSEVKPPAPSQPLVLQGVESAPRHGRGDGHCPPCRALLLSLASGFGTRVWRGAAYAGHLQAESHALSLPVPLCSCGIWGRYSEKVYSSSRPKLMAQATRESAHCQVLHEGHDSG